MEQPKANKPGLRVRTALRLVLLLAVGLVCAAACLLHALRQERLTEEAQQAAVLATAEGLASQLDVDDAGSPEEWQRACDRFLDCSEVLAAVIWDVRKTGVAAATVDDRLLVLLDRPRSAPPGAPTIQLVKLAGRIPRGSTAIYRVDIEARGPLHPTEAQVGFLLSAAGAVSPGAVVSWSFAIPLTALGGAACVLCDRYLRRRISRPIWRLVELLARQTPAAAASARADDEDELERIARSLRELQSEVDRWRDRARHFERRLHRQVAAETQRITRDLRRVQRDVYHDALTGVNNRRMLDEKFPEIFAAQREARQDLSVVMFDVDRFKVVNDTLGHKAGDGILAFVGELLHETLRPDDVAVRYGGDEFLLILPGVSARRALAMAERLRALFDQQVKMMVPIRPPPTLSAGIASLWNNGPVSHADLVELADRALIEAKEAGRNAVRVSGGTEQILP